ncbi:hypothetical protein NGRA_2712 [Nosema granulosis]|uniref:Uncharacterized protein n=1 Tax=Nosema granulosis TaxID=83296 RepID=A0A9P6GWI9_9MICR|nr:hypothetical protein NGRA_2712 [Nosema granulosis]
MQNNINKSFDMATAIKAVDQFGGTENEDVMVWLRDLIFVGEAAGWEENEICRVAVVSLKGKARSWASQVLSGKLSELNLSTLVELLKKRFGSSRMGDTH